MKKTLWIKIILWLYITILLCVFWFASEFSLVSGSWEFIVNCPAQIDVIINTKWQDITASDMILEYDEKNIEIVGFEPGDFFSINRWLQRFSNKISSTAINYPNPVNWIWKFGTLTIIPKELWIHNISFLVNKIGRQETTDTNIAYQGEDYLSAVKNIQILSTEWNCENKEINTNQFAEYDSSMPYDEFEKERSKKLDKLENKNYIRSLTEIGIIFLTILFIILFIKKYQNKNTKK